jgi:hypothetical protein
MAENIISTGKDKVVTVKKKSKAIPVTGLGGL